MSKIYQLLSREHVASIRDVQKHPSKKLRGITRVMRGSKTLGFFFSNEEFDELLEDLEAASSKSLRAEVRKVRKGLKKGDTVSLSALAKEYGV
jgi:hypothetical protein